MKKIFRTMLAALTVGAMVLACGPDNKIDQPTEPENPEIVDPENPDPENPENPDKPVDPENPETPGETIYYKQVTGEQEDWSGNYLIAAETSDAVMVVLGAWDPYGQPVTGLDLNDFITEDGVPAEKVDMYRCFVEKSGDDYTVNVPAIGYLGLMSSSNKLYREETPVDGKFHWFFNWHVESGAVRMYSSSYSSRYLQWNSSAPRFACYTGGQQDLTFFKREVPLAEGIQPTPDPDQPVVPVEQHFKVNGTVFEVDATATEQKVHVTSNVSWTVEVEAGLEADKIEGKDNQQVLFNFQANTTNTARAYRAVIRTAADVTPQSYEIKIVQKGKTEAPVDPDDWTRVKYDYDLHAGDVIRIACSSAGSAAGKLNEKDGYFISVPATFTEDMNKMKSSEAVEFTLGGMKGEWTLTSSAGTIAAVGQKTLSYKGAPAHWQIRFENDGTASMRCNYGRLIFNASAPRFTVYQTTVSTQMRLVEIYKKNWTPSTENGRRPEVDLQLPIVSSISESGANLGQIYNNATNVPVKYGFQYSSDPDAFEKSTVEYVEANGAEGTDGAFYKYVSTLLPNTTYYFRSYIKLYGTGDFETENKTFYSQIVEFKTKSSGGDRPGGGDVPGGDVNTSEVGWFELPAIVDADENGVHDQDNSLYYASHLCAGGERYANGNRARNFTVCYSSKYVGPMWVAAPRHSMYLGSSGRSEAYKVDPEIPSSIQYNSKKTGGGCNKAGGGFQV